MQQLVPLLTDNPDVGKIVELKFTLVLRKLSKKDFAKIKAAVAQPGKY